jgi:hypothetical protein
MSPKIAFRLVSVFAGCTAFPEATQPSFHGGKRHSEICESAPQVGVNCLAPLFLQREKFNDKALPLHPSVYLNIMSIVLSQETTGSDRLSGLLPTGEHQY